MAGTPPRDEPERMGPDDEATRREGEFLADALTRQARAAAAGDGSRPGCCANCGEPCLPLAKYCDDECRADHERRLRVLARQGRAA